MNVTTRQAATILTTTPSPLDARGEAIAPARGARLTLAASSLILLAVGTTIVLDPHAYQAGMGVVLPHDPTLSSDLRAMGMGLLGFGALLGAGATWSAKLGHAAAIGGAVLYTGYGLGRVLSIALDGMPAATLVGSTAIELVVGALLALVVVKGKLR